MADTIQEKKITQEQADQLQSSMELDLTALFKVLKDDMLELSEGYEGSPDGFINDLLSLLSEPGGEVTKGPKPSKEDMYKVAGKLLKIINKRKVK